MTQEIISTSTVGLPQFSAQLNSHGQVLLRSSAPTTAQINMGKLCNLACLHCHVEAGPKRTEIMTETTIQQLLTVLANSPHITTVDLTGGAPELNPHFKSLITRLSERGYRIIDRCNLTVLFEEGQASTAEFLAAHKVEIVASLPCYSELNVDTQRGKGSFSKSIQALLLLNKLGYGRDETLVLNLVYNPVGTHLPPSQATLEAEYRQRMNDDFTIQFNHLLTITNMPIKRFEHQLIRDGQYDDYMALLFSNFNPEAAKGIMCKDIVSVSWDGALYDCDFNQMLEIPLHQPQTLWDISSFSEQHNSPIETNQHCYGCTAGSGSSCSGTTI